MSIKRLMGCQPKRCRYKGGRGGR